MKIIVCIDDSGGMAFNGRRVSRDRAVRERIAGITRCGILRMNGYSAKMFAPQDNILVSDDFIVCAKEDDFCFVENTELTAVESDINTIIIYKWNRAYPSDIKFDLTLTDKMELISSVDFTGFSHEKITEEIYIKK